MKKLLLVLLLTVVSLGFSINEDHPDYISANTLNEDHPDY
jgi:hypothetical protein